LTVSPSIFFDFGGTLCESRADLLPFFREAARCVGVDLPWDRYLAANEECWDELWPDAPKLVGQIPSFADRVHERALQRIGFEGPTEAFVRSVREFATSPRWHVPYPETEATLARLRARGYSLHVISGNVDYLPILIANLGWSGHFDTVTFSQEVGVQKPDPRVFRFALERAGVEPQNGVYVGDSWRGDYLGAQKAGMAAVWLNRQGLKAPGPCRQIRDLTGLEALFDHPP
jgi:FMN hydrolase / 5-amino-6-(5-phospho-D-ribitylamino)uracil phosphatase